MADENKSIYEKSAWILFYVGIGIMIFFFGLFLLHRTFSCHLPVDSAIWGQYGDLIAGTVGIFMTFVSFLLLYQNLLDQKKQFSTQNKAATDAFKQQGEQFQKQSENQVFFSIIEKQQNRINNGVVNDVSGYQIFKILTDAFRNKLTDDLPRLARVLLSDRPEFVDEYFSAHLFDVLRADPDNPRPDINTPEELREVFYEELRQYDKQGRWEYLKYWFNSIGFEVKERRDVLSSLGQRKFYKVDFSYRVGMYQNAFSIINGEYGSFLDIYFKELEFITELINKSLNKDAFSSYVKFLFTGFEKIIIFYFLLAGKGSRNFYNLIKEAGILTDLYEYSGLIIDSPSKEELDDEVAKIDQEYLKINQ